MVTRRRDLEKSGRGACLGVATLAVLLLALAFPLHARAAETGVVPDLTWATSTSDQDRTAVALRDVGARWVRLNANWADAEPTKGNYSDWWFHQYDRAVDLARGAGARIVLMSYQSPSWASGSSVKETPPKNPADFARYMGYLASRYAGKVDAYEIWNEPNIPRFWSTGPSASAYVSLLKPAYAAIKAADPNAKVVFGGLSTNDYRFVEDAYSAGAKGYFDVMSVHPYTCANSPEVIRRDSSGRMTRDTFAAYREVRASMVAAGDAKPIWFTEFGWSTTTAESCGVSEATQADYLTKALRFAEQDPYVQVALWYNFRNNYWDHDADTLEARYGLMRTDFSPKPAYQSLKSYATGSGSNSSAPSATPGPTQQGAGKRRTSTTLSVTSRASASAARRTKSARRRHRRRKAIVGKVRGATAGRVTLRLKRFNRARHRWGKAITRHTEVHANGSFAKALGRLARGRWRVRGLYEGAPGFESSSSRTLHFKA
jgi:Cellulase (glycosyl hydrolase family 5)